MSLTAVPAGLEAILPLVWNSLSAASNQLANPWCYCTLATLKEGHPEQRLLILRHVDPATRELAFHTDRRSPKIGQLQASPVVSGLFFDGVQRLQLTVNGTASIHTSDAVAEREWARASAGRRRSYLILHPPGTPAGGPSPNLPDWALQRPPEDDELAAARPNFAVIQLRLSTIDILSIQPTGSWRARFVWNETDWQGEWLEP
ncbi:pyridoxamine 5'-phosphate oxidase family protein [Planctomicrobium sp. SH664]|uniref:pyridoxamine 5'-phosphate oxidase family protein n=1 Tax=Planctomicrobium sp. SH664 TaxID=3448125 RepID=UPI003F5AECE5